MDLRQARMGTAGFPPVLLVHGGTVDEGEAVLATLDPLARAIADPDQNLYRAFLLPKARYSQIFGLPVLKSVARSFAKGAFGGKPGRDVWQMPGWFLIKDNVVRWSYESAHIGDHPDFDGIPEIIRNAENTVGS